MECIILAGGFGTRLSHIIKDVPKPMAPVCGRPFLRYILDDLISKGATRIILAVGYKREIIMNYFGDSYRGAEIIYSSEDTPLYTGGAIKKALSLCHENSVFVVNGDTFFNVDLATMSAYMAEKKEEFVLAAKPMHGISRYGLLEINEGRITAFKEKEPMVEGIINGGIYLMRRDFLDDMSEEKFSFENDVLEKRVSMYNLWAFESDGYFIDIGIPEDYVRAQEDFQGKVKARSAVFLDRDGTINEEVNYLYRSQDMRFIPGMPEIIKRFNDNNYLVIVVTNQAGIARGYYTEDDVRKLHRYMNERLAEFGAHVDAFYFCPHHPDITGPCHCRKPETGMLEQACREFDIDLSGSLMVGDKPWDIECGKRMRIKSYYIHDLLDRD